MANKKLLIIDVQSNLDTTTRVARIMFNNVSTFGYSIFNESIKDNTPYDLAIVEPIGTAPNGTYGLNQDQLNQVFSAAKKVIIRSASEAENVKKYCRLAFCSNEDFILKASDEGLTQDILLENNFEYKS